MSLCFFFVLSENYNFLVHIITVDRITRVRAALVQTWACVLVFSWPLHFKSYRKCSQLADIWQSIKFNLKYLLFSVALNFFFFFFLDKFNNCSYHLTFQYDYWKEEEKKNNWRKKKKTKKKKTLLATPFVHKQ